MVDDNDGVSLTSVPHPIDPVLIQRLCDAALEALRTAGIDNKPLVVGQSDDVLIDGTVDLRVVVQAVLDELAVIDSKLQISEDALETLEFDPGVGTLTVHPLAGSYMGRKVGEMIEIKLLPGETVRDAIARLGL